MARPKSEDKRLALLDAATDAIAELGLGAATSLIARKAGVAEGTLFRYFPTKDELLNAVYLHHKQDLGNELMKTYDRHAPSKERSRTVWGNYIDWGLVNVNARKAMRQLAVSGKITPETMEQVYQAYPDLRDLSKECVTNEVLTGIESAFADAIFFGLAETTMEFAGRDPSRRDEYKSAGFDVMWRGMTKG
ncbi:TetR/AcrR family transcriptional regulator [Cedecea neteri]|uniref:TetR family transcriptional regulator n=1 Tax=Cedecea neteri TaxID=158822 RepID=A0AAN0S110_9ENTR|nr:MULTISPECIES: TetR/AcrR family transcriptional regulator [Cedecea]AIR59312.1 TetR family transcriptional regulator [Cedecea neteri]NIG78024.1 TetR/AcrR family transcriptional regulator [Klebsiella sp. Ap-873]WNJ80358.1 TetR/AcrR family transcriptional regulator [Cedecea neteri]SMG40303.1 transcriptional regulator, TetR family [Cedecea sp. NFIX57]